jgi:hypothetical protein
MPSSIPPARPFAFLFSSAQLVEVLEANRNKTIADIGSLDLTFTL